MKQLVKASWWFVACFAAVYGQNWGQISGALKHVSASVNYIWGVNSADQIWMCPNPCSAANWVQIPGALKQVDAGDMEAWGVNSNDDIYKRNVDGSGSWTQLPGKLKHVSASGNGYIWGVNSNDDIFKCKKPCTGGWEQVPGKLKQIDGGYDYVYGVNSNNDIYTLPVDGSGSWRLIPGKLKHVTASGTHSIFGTAPDDSIWRCKKPCIGEWERIDGGLMQCDATINGLFGVNSANNIWRSALGL